MSSTRRDDMGATGLSNALGLHLARTLPRKRTGLFSPISAYFALGALLKASSGSTRHQIAELIGDPDVDAAELEVERVFRELRECEEVSISNGLFYRSDITLVPAGEEELVGSLRARVQEWGSNPIAGATLINDWVREATKGRIAHIVDQLHPADIAVLVNALTFDGMWSKPFMEVAEPPPFQGLSGKQRVPMMAFADEEMGYARGSRYSIFELSYLRSFTFRMLVPHRGSAQELMRTITSKDLDTPVEPTQANFTMPRFELRATMDVSNFLPEALKEVPIDLRRLLISHMPVVMPKMCQEAWIEVDLFGTKAAAATWTYFRTLCINPEPIDLCVDRPFVFWIRHAPTGRALFMGWVDDFE